VGRYSRYSDTVLLSAVAYGALSVCIALSRAKRAKNHTAPPLSFFGFLTDILADFRALGALFLKVYKKFTKIVCSRVRFYGKIFLENISL
jgi:hypothetical protein